MRTKAIGKNQEKYNPCFIKPTLYYLANFKRIGVQPWVSLTLGLADEPRSGSLLSKSRCQEVRDETVIRIADSSRSNSLIWEFGDMYM